MNRKVLRASPVPWDSSYRTRRIDEHDKPISDEEYRRWEWMDCTSMYDPDDVRRLARTMLRFKAGGSE